MSRRIVSLALLVPWLAVVSSGTGCDSELEAPVGAGVMEVEEDDVDEDRLDLGTLADVPDEGDASPSHTSSPGVFSVRGVRPESSSPERAHADGGTEISISPAAALAGELCNSSDECEAGTQCVSDSIASDGELRCLTVCVDPNADNADAITCVDDAGCCDETGVCNDDGTCVVPGGGGGGGGGSDPAADGSGCNEGCDFDRDDDGVVNSLDAHPDQSCSADADQDGINDSCDANDMSSDDGCLGCGVPPLRTNGLFWAYAVIFLAIRGRRRRVGR
jgi:hypothetical protein